MTKEELAAAWELSVGALTLYREASGEPHEGKLGVWWVIKNRVSDDRWPGTVSGVCLQRKQFSCFNPGDPTNSHWPHQEDPIWNDCLAIVTGDETDPTNGATHYHSIYIPRPYWTADLMQTVIIKRHVFYR